LETKQENYDRDNEKCENEGTHDDNHDAHALASSYELNSNGGHIIIVVNTIHCNCDLSRFSGDVRRSLSDIWSKAKDRGPVNVGCWR
jgi:hypothetical protein